MPFTENYTVEREELEVVIDGPQASGEVFKIFKIKKSPNTDTDNTKSILRKVKKGLVLN